MQQCNRKTGIFSRLIFLFCLSPAITYADVSHDHLVSLAQSPYWQTLLHFDGQRSEIDDPRFFLSPQGSYDPYAELEATLLAMQAPRQGDDHAWCRYPARRQWLIEQGVLSRSSRLCPAYDEALAHVQPTHATLVFPSAHMNSPASMFGHTLLRLETPTRDRLTAYAVNYSANTQETNGLIYAYQGIFGGYEGYYSLPPYYEKIQEYNDIEHRDIWEYDLSLTPQEVKRLFDHVWELKDRYSYYYFFTKNCSYNLLWLLQSGREGLDVRQHLGWSKIPIDTIRAVEREGLIQNVYYRPSVGTTMATLAHAVGFDETQRAMRMAQGEKGMASNNPLSYDLSALYLRSLYLHKNVESSVYKQRYLDLLTTRSRMETLPTPKEVGENPLLGHLSSRWGVGIQGGDNQGLRLKYRGAYHDGSDLQEGFLRGAGIEFGAIDATIHGESLFVNDASLVSISSLSPWYPPLATPISWRAGVGIHDNHALATGSAGLTWGYDDWLLWGLADGGLRGFVGLGLSTGVQYGQKSWQARAEYRRFEGLQERSEEIDGSYRYRLFGHHSFVIEWKKRIEKTSTSLLWEYYF